MKGLVLEGGGAKGAFHCGAVKALYDHGYTFNGVAGTSIGAINGALIVQDCGYESLFNMWTSVTAEDITYFDNMEVNRLFNKEFTKSSLSYWAKQTFKTISNLGLPVDKINKYLHTVIDEEKVRKSNMDLAIVTYCLTDHQPKQLFKEDINDGELHDYLLANAYYPAFKLGRMKGKLYIDGGVYDNLPLNVLPARKEYDEIFAIRTMSRMPYREINNNDVTVRYVCPSEDLGKTFNIKQRSVNHKIKLGYYDAMRYIKGYFGCKFYFSEKLDYFERIFKNLNKNQIRDICYLLKINESNYYDELVAYLVSTTIEDVYSSANPFVAFFETIGQKLDLEKFHIYSIKDYIGTLVKKFVSYDTEMQKKHKDKYEKILLSIFKIILPTIQGGI